MIAKSTKLKKDVTQRAIKPGHHPDDDTGLGRRYIYAFLFVLAFAVVVFLANKYTKPKTASNEIQKEASSS